MRISLLHATYRSGNSAVAVKRAWLEHATMPQRIEHIFAMDSDDLDTIACTAEHLRVVSEPLKGRVTAVRNWNAAAATATGDLLMVIADDLYPPQGWDSLLETICGSWDPNRTPFAVKVCDSPLQGETLMRHPVVSRRFYDGLGLFADAFDGVFADDDFTTMAFWKSTILDGRGLVLEHRHPDIDPRVAASISHRRINTSSAYNEGYETYRQRWNAIQRGSTVKLLNPTSSAASARWKQEAWERTVRVSSSTRYVLGRARKALRLIRKPLTR